MDFHPPSREKPVSLEKQVRRADDALGCEEALICTMVLVAASGGGITDREIGVMSGLVQTLPVFQDFSTARLKTATEMAVALLREENGLAHAGRLIGAALAPRLCETAYALACEVVAADLVAERTTLEMLAYVERMLGLDPLIAKAIERATRARYQRVTP
jgi:uncharacterized membrane protein YebE (DUF533 family)